MRYRVAVGLAVLMAATMAVVGTDGPAHAQEKDKEKKSQPAKFLYGHDVRVRPGGKADFDKDTPRIGIEFYQDDATGALIAISEMGSLAVAPAGPVGPEKKMKWLTAHELSVRRAGEPEFTQKTKKYGIELFRDLGSNHLLYACDTGAIALAPVPGGLVTERGPKWHHAGEFRVRSVDQVKFDNARKFGVEVFKDENTGGLLYVTEAGSISAAPAPAAPPDAKKIAPPKVAYGLILRVRGAAEADFDKKTKEIGIEVFEDTNANNNLLYITESGSIAAVPNTGIKAEAKGVAWRSAMALKARHGGEKDFDGAKKYGIEVFADNRTGNLIFVCETGSIAVLPKP
jgi:hypothetical protein